MAKKNPRQIGGCLLDLDGTVYQAGRAIPGVPDALQSLRRAGIPFRFVTNTTRRPRAAILSDLEAMKIDASEDDILTAPLAAAAWLRSRKVGKILPLLDPRTLPDLGLIQIDETTPEVVLVGDLGENWSFDVLDRAFRALMNGAALVAIQKGRYWRKGEQLSLDAGAFVAALEFASGQTAQVIGKPSAEFFYTASAQIGLPPGRVAMVGDDIVSDIAGARHAGLVGVAVRTGQYEPQDEDEARRVSDAVIDSLANLPQWLGLQS